jgi:short-subunit dehydrogenase
MLTESLRFELEGTGAQVQVVCLALTKTDIHSWLGISEDATADRGPFRWITPQEVFSCSLRCLKKNKVLCIPSRMTRMQIFMRRLSRKPYITKP